jgi:hypothetical protein
MIMAESYEATIEWSGSLDLGTVLLAAASRPKCSAKLNQIKGTSSLSVVVKETSIQALRDVVDELLIALSDIEEHFQVND